MTPQQLGMSRARLVSLVLSPKIGRRGFCIEPKDAVGEAGVEDCKLIMEQMNYLKKEYAFENRLTPSPGTYIVVLYEIRENGKLELTFPNEKIDIV